MNNSELISFLQNAKPRSNCDFSLTYVVKDGYGNVTGIEGKISVKGTSGYTDTLWGIDGRNTTHGVDYDLVLFIEINDFLS